MSSGCRRPRSRRDVLKTLAAAGIALPAGLGVLSPVCHAAATPTGVTFTDVTSAAGLLRAQNTCGSATNKQFLLEEMGSGVAFLDYDNDGWLDIFLVNGATFDPSRGAEADQLLFHNNRDGTFTDVTGEGGPHASGWGQGCCVGDYDNDGYDDLFVSYWGATSVSQQR